jgi:hypothetical protein
LPKIVAEIEELKKQILNQKMETMVKQKTIKTEISPYWGWIAHEK